MTETLAHIMTLGTLTLTLVGGGLTLALTVTVWSAVAGYRERQAMYARLLD